MAQVCQIDSFKFERRGTNGQLRKGVKLGRKIS